MSEDGLIGEVCLMTLMRRRTSETDSRLCMEIDELSVIGGTRVNSVQRR